MKSDDRNMALSAAFYLMNATPEQVAATLINAQIEGIRYARKVLEECLSVHKAQVTLETRQKELRRQLSSK